MPAGPRVLSCIAAKVPRVPTRPERRAAIGQSRWRHARNFRLRALNPCTVGPEPSTQRLNGRRVRDGVVVEPAG